MLTKICIYMFLLTKSFYSLMLTQIFERTREPTSDEALTNPVQMPAITKFHLDTQDGSLFMFWRKNIFVIYITVMEHNHLQSLAATSWFSFSHDIASRNMKSASPALLKTNNRRKNISIHWSIIGNTPWERNRTWFIGAMRNHCAQSCYIPGKWKIQMLYLKYNLQSWGFEKVLTTHFLELASIRSNARSQAALGFPFQAILVSHRSPTFLNARHDWELSERWIFPWR